MCARTARAKLLSCASESDANSQRCGRNTVRRGRYIGESQGRGRRGDSEEGRTQAQALGASLNECGGSELLVCLLQQVGTYAMREGKHVSTVCTT